ncbi:MAG: tripartite tricarboxylate transporter substrate binding protein [Pigmentiphaga sp.]|uniref:Bug family tripartite tricarboxylate transporter substrate binding protein n=1 Tax=Pigmentiphaga sp. TaxID=1977564 RepID=UPI0029B68325|nr:tripartite tricarboxylate transporter substrate binding protein [Pigmentiphaga sp.]MDX3907637.1 tripartite tricarboxylate transporter substrate binding protein [Pigmentiphaga sp.]
MVGKRRAWLAALLAAATYAVAGPAPAADGSYPERPVRIIVALGPGSATDSFARMLAEGLRSELKGDFIVENKAGAGGVIGGNFIAKAAPDGYTLGVLHSSVVTSATVIQPAVQYDPRTDFTYLGNTVSNPVVLLVPGASPFKKLEDLIEAAKKEPGRYNTGIIGMGSHSHFNLELLKSSSGAGLTRVPYSGGTSQILADLVGNQVDSASLIWAGLTEFIKEGKVRALAATSPLKGFPDVPTFESKGYPKVHLEVFLAVVAPPGLPKEISDKLVPAIERIVKNPRSEEMMSRLGYRVNYEPPAKAAQTIKDELEFLVPLAKQLSLTVKE